MAAIEGIRGLVAVTIAAIISFLFFPTTDIAISHYFYMPGQGFIYEWHPFVRGVYQAVRYVSTVYIALLAIAGILKLLGFLREISWRKWIYLALVLLIGPCLMIEAISKEAFNRPRPREVIDFGGAMNYVPPLHIGTEKGKSFTSSHAAAGFYVAAFAFFYRGRKHAIIYVAGVALGLSIGLIRIIQGGHFASDVVFAGLIMLWVIHILARILLTKERAYA